MANHPANNQSNGTVKNALDRSRSLTNKQKRVQVRKNAQQTLLYLHDVIAINNQRYYTSDDSDKVPAIPVGSYAGSPGHGVLVADPPKWKSGYKNIIPIEKGSSEDGVSPITSLGKDVEKFFTFKLTSAQQAALYPKIRLYKIEYELDGNGNIVLPFIEKARKEIIFEKAITTKELQILTDKGGNIGSSGIESFDWKLMGVNPAEVDSNIEASLKIYFNNIGVFAERIENLRSASELESSIASKAPFATDAFINSVVQSSFPDLNQAHFLDLITFAPPTSKGLDSLPCSEVYDPSFFEILAEVGWEVADTGTALFDADQEIYINRQTVSLYLTLTDHKFDFKEDGSATLVANYRARQTFSGPRDDILYPPAELKSQIDNLEKLKTDDEPDTGKVEDTEKDISKLLKQNYKRIISGLLENLYEAEIPNALLLNSVLPVTRGRFSAADLGAEGFQSISYGQLIDLLQNQGDLSVRHGNFGGGVTRTAQLQKAIADIQSQINDRKNIKVKRKSLGTGDTGPGSALANTKNNVINPDDNLTDDASPFGSAVTVSDDLQTGTIQDRSAGALNKIQFFYLGDILEVMLETIKMSADLRDKKVAFVLTDFQYLNLLKIIEAASVNTTNNKIEIQNFDFANFKCKQKTLKPEDLKKFYSILNVANIPIEATAFLDFFTEKVVAQDRQSYYLNNFLNDIFTNLVKPALGDNAILGIPNNQPALINIDISAVDTINSPLFIDGNKLGIHNPRTSIGNENKEYKLGTDDSTEYIWISTIKEYIDNSANNAVFWQNPTKNAKGNVATVKVLGVNGGVNFLDGKYNTNIKYNISNFVVGLDRGIIKSVSFERVDQPHLREARTATDKSFGVGQLRELYNVNLTLYGNNILKPGNMIYVEPNRFIFGRPTEIASVSRLLGLGGYHLVVDVSNTIGKEGWETTVKALHMAMPAIPE